MGSIKTLAREVYRYFNIDNVPDSGKRLVPKDDVFDLFDSVDAENEARKGDLVTAQADLEDQIQAAANGDIIYPDIATGRAAVANGEFFRVAVEGEDVSFVVYRRLSVSTEEVWSEQPSVLAVTGVSDKLDGLIEAAPDGVYIPASPADPIYMEVDDTGRPIGYTDGDGSEWRYTARGVAVSVDPLRVTGHAGGIYVPGFTGTVISVEDNTDGRALELFTDKGERWAIGTSGGYEKVQLSEDLSARPVTGGALVPGLPVEVSDFAEFSDGRVGDVIGQDGRRYMVNHAGAFMPQYDESGRYDGIIYGTGMGGLLTLVRAAMYGKRICVLEPYDRFGGMHAAGLTYVDIPDGSAGFETNIHGGLTASLYFRMVDDLVGLGVIDFVSRRYLADANVYERVAQQIIARFATRSHTNVRLEPRDVVTETDGFGNKRVLGVQTRYGFIRGVGFADASYEGDLMAGAVGKAGYTWGRESAADYGEASAGYRAPGTFPNLGPSFAFYTGAGSPAALGYPLIADPGQAIGAGDKKVQAYNIRVPLTRNAANRRPLIKPYGYQGSLFTNELQILRMENRTQFCRNFTSASWGFQGNLLNQKLAWNAADFVNGNVDYPDGNWTTRDRIQEEHVLRQQGLMWCVQNDPIALDYGLAALQADAADIGLCEDEFEASRWGHGWSWQMYVREGRRLKAMTMMTQADITTGGTPTKADSIGKWSYYPDIHAVQAFTVSATQVAIEGAGNAHTPTATYQIPWSALLPPKATCSNLIVPVCAGFTHQAWAPQRLEIAEAICGEAAGEGLAWMADNPNLAIQDMAYATLAARLLQSRSKL